MTAFAHISDPHLPLRPGLSRPLRLLAGKRLLGYLSWRTRRHRRHLPAVLDTVCRDIAAHRPDHLLVTGDLVNIALPEEFAAARDWLEGLGPPRNVTVVPGNHDTTVPVAWRSGLGLWEPWMSGDDGAAAAAEERFPFVRRCGAVAFVNLSSAVTTAPLLASGRLGGAQLARAAARLRELGEAGSFRVVAIHHPPVPGVVSARKGLGDCTAFADMIQEAGAELVVHGHCHHSHFTYLASPQGPVPVVGVPSASAPIDRLGRHARWHLFRVDRADEGWRLSVTVRGLDQGGACATEGGWSMLLHAGVPTAAP